LTLITTNRHGAAGADNREDSGMTLDEFQLLLTALQPGKAAHVPYDIFEILFPPGAEDDGARSRAYAFAEASGCVIEHRANDREVLFVKPTSAT
jgi:hypothetical protein